MFGDGLELVVPEVGFVVATAVSPDGPEPGAEPLETAASPRQGYQAPALVPPSRGVPVHINVCATDKVAAGTTSKTPRPGGTSGQGWFIPFTLGGQQDVQAPERCRTIHFVCHSDTRKLCQCSNVLLNMVVETAVEEAGKALRVPLLRAYRIPSEAYRGEEGQDK